MAKKESPLRKKKYESPSIIDPASGLKGGANFVPLGTTGCTYGDVGSTCANGTAPQGGASKCTVGGQPEILNCNTGTSAGDNCINGTDAQVGCDVGTSVLGDCTSGITPLEPNCISGTSAISCGAGTGAG